MTRRGRPPLREAIRETREEKRRKVNPIGRARLKLDTPQIPGYDLRWVNDDGMRLQDLTTNDDWDFVTKNEIKNTVGEGVGVTPEQAPGEKVSRVVDRIDGKPLYAFLLKKKTEWVEADKVEKDKAIIEIEDQIKRNEKFQVDHQRGDVKISRPRTEQIN